MENVKQHLVNEYAACSSINFILLHVNIISHNTVRSIWWFIFSNFNQFVCVVIIRLEPSNYFSGILFCFLVYVLYVLPTMYVYVSTWVYGLLDFE